MQFDRGYISPYFVTDPERMESAERHATWIDLSSLLDVPGLRGGIPASALDGSGRVGADQVGREGGA
jgi:hypothetical protein